MRAARRARAVSLLLLVCLLRAAALAQPIEEKLERALSDPSFKVRLQAAIVIGKRKMTELAPLLRKALKDSHPTVQAAAALSLGRVGDQAARPDLAKLLGHENELVQKAAEKALVILDKQRPIRPRFLIAIDEVTLTEGIAASHGQKLTRTLQRKLEAQPSVQMAAGENRALGGDALQAHLKRRKLVGLTLRPRLLKLLATESGGTTSLSCKISVMTVTMGSNRMEFSGNGDADAEVDSLDLGPDEVEELQSRLLDASTNAAAEEVIAFLGRRQGP
ncbi:MAG: HEAT repeat domain-containing protein [Deltaproteobacteria bacterium]|nr:HEAT repeat domain-containing protein [Deltaproteobacteria bacterium]